jgi:ubiquinone/menaquinone biosynthesis C-methylase UbiE
MNKKNKTSWGKVANWYDALLSADDTYQTQVILPNLLRLINIKEGDRILDIACGQGFFSRAFALEGALVVGSDIASELVEFAKKKAGPQEKYFVAPADSMKANIADGSFDIVTIVLALQNIENLNGVLKEAARALKEGGRLFIVLNHPVFRNPKHTAWNFDEKNNIQYRRIDEYLSESKTDIEMTPGGDKKNVTVSFHRSLQQYSKALAKNHFLISKIEEWNSHKKSEFGPRQKAEDKARKEIPMFMLIEVVKLVK